MKLISCFGFFLLWNLLACKSRDNQIKNCIYTIDSLASKYDTSLFLIRYFKEEKVTDFIEPRNKDGETGMYSFDEKGRIFFYGFLMNDTNLVRYSVQYDSLGNEVGRTSGDVVYGLMRNSSNDTLISTFALSTIQHKYEDVFVRMGNDTIKCKELYASNSFSNIIGRTISFPFPKNMRERMVYVEGNKRNICTNKVEHFIDSTEIPSELFK